MEQGPGRPRDRVDDRKPATETTKGRNGHACPKPTIVPSRGETRANGAIKRPGIGFALENRGAPHGYIGIMVHPATNNNAPA